MRNLIIFFTSIILIAGFTLAGCDSSAEKLADVSENAKDSNDNVAEAEYNLFIPKKDSEDEYMEYKKESEERIAEYEKRIAELKTIIAEKKNDGRSNYQKLLAGLEQKTVELKSNLNDYTETGKDKWVSFKNEFNNDLDSLGTAISNFFTNENNK